MSNMRANGVRSLNVCCWLCHQRRSLSADSWPDHVAVPTFGARMVCTCCGIVGADARARIVARYGGDARARTLYCAEQYRAMEAARPE
jgi:hypothetical protein